MGDGKRIIIGTRKSRLAMWQAEHIKGRLTTEFPEIEFEIKKIVTTGDKILDAPLSKIGDKGLFTKQIETALLDGEIDLAVHSLKDLPTAIETGLVIGAITEREDPRDALVSKDGVRLHDLPKGAVVATSSLRRRAQLLYHRPDLELADIRGNIDTRLRKLDESEDISAIILARAGLTRMGWTERIAQVIPTAVMLPAVGQGALGIEIRQGDKYIEKIVNSLDHRETRLGTVAERALLASLEGGCQVPIGAYGQVHDGKLRLEALVSSTDGKRYFRDAGSSDLDSPKILGRKLAERLVEMGAGEILEEIYANARSEK